MGILELKSNYMAKHTNNKYLNSKAGFVADYNEITNICRCNQLNIFILRDSP